MTLAKRYVDPNADFPPPALYDRPGYVTRIRPQRFAGHGPWAEKHA
jgi:hypothetical protein